MINGANPLGANQVLRPVAPSKVKTIRFSAGVSWRDKNPPNQWLRLRRVETGSVPTWTDGKTWSPVGQRYSQLHPASFVGTYAFSASHVATDGNPAARIWRLVPSNYETPRSDTAAPRLRPSAPDKKWW